MIEGSGVMLAGQGAKSGIGKTLVGLGTIGGLSSIKTGKAIEGAIGGAILAGIGGLLIAADKKKKQSGRGMKSDFDKHFRQALKQKIKLLQQHGSGNKKITAIKKLIEPHLDKPIHIKDIFGEDYKKHAKVILDEIKKYKKSQMGSGKVGDFFKNVGKKATPVFKKVGQKAEAKFKQFLAGKTKVKPSTLLDISAGVVGLVGAASAFVPVLDFVSVPGASAAALGLKSAAHLARMKGRGIGGCCEGCGGDCDIQQIGGMSPEAIEGLMKLGDATLIAGALGITVAAAAALIKLFKTQHKFKTDKKYRYSGKGIESQIGGMDEAMINMIIKVGDAAILAAVLGITVGAAAGLLKAAKAIKKRVKKMKGSGIEVFADGTQWADPEMVPDAARKLVSVLASQSGPIMSKSAIGAAIGLTGAALIGAYALYKKLKKSKKGNGVKLAGQGLKLAGQGIKMPESIRIFIEDHPEISKKVALLVKSGEKLGGGKVKTLMKILGVGITIARAAYSLYKFLQSHPIITDMLVLALSHATGLPQLEGRGTEKLPYGVKLLPSGKIKKDRYSVYYGYHKKTSSGLTKDDFIKKGRKIISKKKHEQGKRMAKNLIPYQK